MFVVLQKLARVVKPHPPQVSLQPCHADHIDHVITPEQLLFAAPLDVDAIELELLDIVEVDAIELELLDIVEIVVPPLDEAEHQQD
jgi:hypothetical protein